MRIMSFFLQIEPDKEREAAATGLAAAVRHAASAPQVSPARRVINVARTVAPSVVKSALLGLLIAFLGYWLLGNAMRWTYVFIAFFGLSALGKFFRSEFGVWRGRPRGAAKNRAFE